MNEPAISLTGGAHKVKRLYRVKSPEQRFLKYVDKTSSPLGCWLWTGVKASNGYGHIGVKYETISTHRFSWMIANGPIPKGMCVLHRCDVKKCVNPAHLFLGTIADNIKDCHAKGRNAKGPTHWMKIHPEKITKGSAVGNSKLTEADVKDIRKRRASGEKLSEIANHYKVTKQSICGITHWKAWKHVAPD